MNEQQRQALRELSEEDLHAQLKSDPMYQAVMRAVPPENHDAIEQIVMEFVTAWKEGAIDKIISASSNPDFVAALLKVMSENDPKFKAGDVI